MSSIENMKKIIISLLCIALFPVSCVALNFIGLRITEKFLYKEIGQNNIPELFPLLVIQKANDKYIANTTYYKFVSSISTNENKYTFLVPEKKSNEIRKLLKQTWRANRKQADFKSESKDPWIADFKILETLSDGSQIIKVSSTWDDDWKNVGIYQATKNDFIPKKYLSYFGPGIALQIFPVALIITISVWIFSIKMYKLKKKNT